MNFKICAKCEACKRRSLLIKRRSTRFPGGKTVKSQKLICKKCVNAVRKLLGAVTNKDHD